MIRLGFEFSYILPIATYGFGGFAEKVGKTQGYVTQMSQAAEVYKLTTQVVS